MSIISQLNTANTFSQWLTATQDLVTKTNSLIEGGGNYTFYSNTNLSIANNVTIGGDLTVSGNIILDQIGFDDINSNGSITAANNLTISGNTSLQATTITLATVDKFAGAANTAVYANVASAYARAADDAVAFAIALG